MSKSATDAAARQGGLENNADNSSSPRKQAEVEAPEYQERYRLLDFLRTNTRRRRQGLCLAAAFAAEVKVVSSKEGKYAYTGLQTCGSITCPACGPRISAHRREEIRMGLDSWTRGHGGKILFGTLTLRHNRTQTHDELANAIAKCWSRATGGSSWLADRKSHGIVHIIRIWETKWNPVNGWHVHVHFLLLVKDGWAVPADLLKSMFGRWRMAAIAAGLAAPMMLGSDLHEVTGDEAAEQLGTYFAKDAEMKGKQTAEQMAWEMSNSDGKIRGAGFTPGLILQLAAAGVGDFLPLFNEYELSMKKRRTIAWSRGSREDLGLDIELTDEEVTERDELQALLEHVTIPARVFRRIARTKGMRSELLDVVREFGGLTAVLWLRRRGFEIYDDQPEEER